MTRANFRSEQFQLNLQERCDLKVTKKQGFTLSLKNTVLEKSWGGGQFEHPSPSPFRFK